MKAKLESRIFRPMKLRKQKLELLKLVKVIGKDAVTGRM